MPRESNLPGHFRPRRMTKYNAGSECTPTELRIRTEQLWVTVRWDGVHSSWDVYLRGETSGDYLNLIIDLTRDGPWSELKGVVYHAIARLIALNMYLRLARPQQPKDRRSDGNAGQVGVASGGQSPTHNAGGVRVGLGTLPAHLGAAAVDAYAKSRKRR